LPKTHGSFATKALRHQVCFLFFSHDPSDSEQAKQLHKLSQILKYNNQWKSV